MRLEHAKRHGYAMVTKPTEEFALHLNVSKASNPVQLQSMTLTEEPCLEKAATVETPTVGRPTEALLAVPAQRLHQKIEGR